MARSLYIWGAFLFALGLFVLFFARPILTWDRIVIEDFGCEFEYPYTRTWSLKHGPSTVPFDPTAYVADETTMAPEATGISDSGNQDMAAYSVSMSELKGSAAIHVLAISFPQDTLGVETIEIIEKLHELRHDDYLMLSRQVMRLDRRDAFRRVATYTLSGHSRPVRRIEVVTYVIGHNTLYDIVLTEDSWLNLPRNLKIYDHIVGTFHIREPSSGAAVN